MNMGLCIRSWASCSLFAVSHCVPFGSHGQKPNERFFRQQAPGSPMEAKEQRQPPLQAQRDEVFRNLNSGEAIALQEFTLCAPAPNGAGNERHAPRGAYL